MAIHRIIAIFLNLMQQSFFIVQLKAIAFSQRDASNHIANGRVAKKRHLMPLERFRINFFFYTYNLCLLC